LIIARGLSTALVLLTVMSIVANGLTCAQPILVSAQVEALWSYELTSYPSSLAIDDTASTIVVGDYGKRLTVLNEAGTVNWSKSFPGAYGIWVQVSPDGKRIFVSDGLKFSAFYDSNGTSLGPVGISGPLEDMSFSANGWYVVPWGGVTLFNSTGKLVWRKSLKLARVASVTISRSGNVIAAIDTQFYPYDNPSNLYMFDRNGTTLWSKAFNVRMTKPQISASGGLVVIGAEPCNLYGLDGKNGEVLWTSTFEPSGGCRTYGLPSDGQPQVTLSADGRFVFAPRAHILNATTGKPIAIRSAPPIFQEAYRDVGSSRDFGYVAADLGNRVDLYKITIEKGASTTSISNASSFSESSEFTESPTPAGTQSTVTEHYGNTNSATGFQWNLYLVAGTTLLGAVVLGTIAALMRRRRD
jgi:hypothetical protein